MAESKVDQTRLLLISESVRPCGATRHALNLYRGLAADLSVSMAVPDRLGVDAFSERERKQIEVFPGMLGGFIRPFVTRRLSAWAQAQRPDLIHGLSAFANPVCQRLARALERPYVLTVNHYQERGGLRVGDRCARILASSEALRENLINTAGVPKELITVVSLGIPLPDASLREARGHDRQPLVVTFSSFTLRTNVSVFLRAARRVLDVRCGACQFLAIGEGPEEPSLRKLARKLNLDKNLTFADPSVPLDRILAEADVYVKVPKQQGFGMSVLEAMAWGVPVVATSVGGLIPLVKEGLTGFQVAVDDPDTTAQRILDILQDEALGSRLGAAAREMVGNTFPYSKMIQQTLSVYASVLGKDTSGGATTKESHLVKLNGHLPQS